MSRQTGGSARGRDPLVHAIGWFDGRYGYNVHTRNLFDALSRRLPVAASPMRILEGPQEEDKREIAETFAPHRDIATIALLYGSLTGVLEGASGTRIAYTVWESTKLPDLWFDPLSKADRIWTASAWGKRVFAANGFDPDRIDVVPEGVDPLVFNPEIPPSAALPRGDVFRFLAVGRWEPRKGLAELVSAFDREFGEQDRVELVLAGLHANQPNLDLRAELRALRLKRPDRLKIIPTVKTHQAFAELYTACDAFVAPSRAEGWGLPISEAMACGLPVIVTGYSGPTEFIGPHARRIEHRLVPIELPYFERADGDHGVWAEPDWSHLRHLMRELMSDPFAARELGLAGSHHIRTRFSWNKAAEAAAAVIQRTLNDRQSLTGRVNPPIFRESWTDDKDVANMRPSNGSQTTTAPHAQAGDRALSDDAIVDHLVARIQAAKILAEPYEFAIVSDALPTAFYEQVDAVYPAPHDGRDYGLKTTKDRRTAENDGYSERRMSLNPDKLDETVMGRMPEPIRQLFRVMTHRRLGAAMIQPFSSTVNRMTRAHLERMGLKPGARKITLKNGVEVIYDQTGFNLAPHTDGQAKVVTGLLYFPQPGDPEDMGTHIYAAKDPDSLLPIHLSGEKALTVGESVHCGYAPYRRNTMLLFARTDRSFHGVPMSASENARRVVQAAINFTGGVEPLSG